MTDMTSRAADVAAIIAERPYTITVYRRSSSSETGETSLTAFTGRIDESGQTAAQERSPQHEGAVALREFILVCPQDSRVVQTKDIVKAVDEADGTSWYKVISVRDMGYCQECRLVARDDA